MKTTEATGLGFLGVIMTLVAVVAGIYIYEYWKNSQENAVPPGAVGMLSSSIDDMPLNDITNIDTAPEDEYSMTGVVWTNIKGAWQHRHIKNGMVIIPPSGRHRHMIKDESAPNGYRVVYDWHSHRSITDPELPGWSKPVDQVYLDS